MSDPTTPPAGDDPKRCWLCRVAERTGKAAIVSETADVLVLISPVPLTRGHALVVPRRHVPDLYELPDELAGPILCTAARTARAAKRAFSADGILLRQHNEAAAGQEVFHFHLHVIPRYLGEPELPTTRPPLIRFDEQEALGSRLRVELGSA